MLTDKEHRAAIRDIEAEHDRIEEPLAVLKKKIEDMRASIAPQLKQIADLDEEIIRLTATLHRRRMEYARIQKEAAK